MLEMYSNVNKKIPTPIDSKCRFLKGQSHEIFDTFLSKNSTWDPYKQAKTVSRRYSQKAWVGAVNDYTDIVSV